MNGMLIFSVIDTFYVLDIKTWRRFQLYVPRGHYTEMDAPTRRRLKHAYPLIESVSSRFAKLTDSPFLQNLGDVTFEMLLVLSFNKEFIRSEIDNRTLTDALASRRDARQLFRP
ncbi:hypothetical protein SDRG_07737 [Saprolegnia diclina VS20]|uniref:Uncharacterized protein n=1 Tax=Saprolegnia diclina (strain VS20) TaxID=1156394 RepID=T0QAM9_SAPDV|nr:hypothetical protein SDRG_07737 [Saprolegnia diclina VS20]EQC34939.1 hypothetical protein SDRG_07737 [Saprolegnia diclina VS20]|eukprot:XP_008611811.1 hypothetical protein SDRG_07737 [Saprolegnia diclina VS20]